jgi:hypothetical protein
LPFGTTSASWLGSVALIGTLGMHSAYTAQYFSGSFIVIALAFELLKLTLATQLNLHIRRLGNLPVTLVLWLLCVGYCWLMPILVLVHAQILPTEGTAFVLCAITWAFVQVASGLTPEVRWSAPSQQVRVDHPPASVDSRVPEPQPNLESGATDQGRTRIDDDGWFEALRKFAGQPGSTIGRGVSISQDRVIVGSQGNLARVLGLSKATLNRRLRQFAKQGQLGLETNDGITRIRIP